MIYEDVFYNLCIYDIRNPNAIKEKITTIEPGSVYDNCYCDNCCYGRTELANFIIENLNNERITITK